MAEKSTEKSAEKTAPAKTKSYSEAKAVYDALAKQCSEFARSMPKIRLEIEKRVKQEMGDADKQLADLMAKKRMAAIEMHEADQREQPERDAKAASAVAAQASAKVEQTRKENEKRKADEARDHARRMREAVAA